MGNTGTDTKQKLIDTALELIWRSSYGSVSVDDICKKAEVKKGSFYHFFPSKVDLALAAMEETTRASKTTLDAVFSAGNDPVERFEHYADFLLNFQEDAAARYGHVCGCPCTSLGSEMAGQEESIRAKFEEITRLKERYFESALRDMVAEGLVPSTLDPKSKAKELYAYILGQLTVARITNDLAPVKRDLKQGLLQLLGVQKKVAEPV
jgi:TetR/AcrR family transcriptional repressor of nem operon